MNMSMVEVSGLPTLFLSVPLMVIEDFWKSYAADLLRGFASVCVKNLYYSPVIGISNFAFAYCAFGDSMYVRYERIIVVIWIYCR